jgi:hypothetical protein
MTDMSEKSAAKQWLDAASDAIASGSSASALSAAMLSWRSIVDEDSAAGGLNGPSQWLWGEREARTKQASVKHTAVGSIIHFGTSLFWAVFYERFFGARHGRTAPARVIAEAAGTTAAAYVVDYYLTPPRFRPGFEKHLTPRSMVFVYVAFAAGLAAVTLARNSRSQDQAAGPGRQDSN